MGDRLTTSEAAFAPILREIGNRGLIYVDDGTSPKSLAGQIVATAGSGCRPLGRRDRPGARKARRPRAPERYGGRFRTAWPFVIERIAKWSKTVEGRGVSLVPITAAAARGKPS